MLWLIVDTAIFAVGAIIIFVFSLAEISSKYDNKEEEMALQEEYMREWKNQQTKKKI